MHFNAAFPGIIGRRHGGFREDADLVTEPVSDALLLQRFANQRDEAAFGELVRRHGPQVRRVCRRGLASEHDAEDVFQATFFVLADKAADISWNGSVDRWLCSVARRLVLHTRAGLGRRARLERPATALSPGRSGEPGGLIPDCYHPLDQPDDGLERSELRRVVRTALGQLPEKYRAPVVLCYLEGKTNQEAARQLGWPAGTMSRRLERARSMLRQRLARCGLIAFLGAVAAGLAFSRISHSGHEAEAAHCSMRQVMQSLTLASPGAGDARDRLRTLESDQGAACSAEQVEALARTFQWVAEQTAGIDSGRDREVWLFHAAKMRLAAIDLGEAARNGDRLALLGAARRLDASCVGCHTAFRTW